MRSDSIREASNSPLVASAFRPKEPGSNIRLPFDTVKYRLPIPDADPRLSVTSHEIVWRPLASGVLSKTAAPSALPIPGYSAIGKRAVRSARLVQPEGTTLRRTP